VALDTNLSPRSIVEGVLNYGDWEDVQKLLKLLGRKKVARIFFQGSQKKRSNYNPKIKHFFKLYLKKYA